MRKNMKPGNCGRGDRSPTGPGHYVVTGLQQHEDYGHYPFDWDGYDVAPDLVKKPFDYDDGDYFEGRYYTKDRYRVHYMEME